MKKTVSIIVLLALLLSAACSAFAEEGEIVPVNDEELLGVWRASDNEALEVLVLPGSYAPLPANARKPQLYISGMWQEGELKRIDYQMLVNRWKEEDNGLLNMLLGNAMANAVKTIDRLSGGNVENPNAINLYDYTHGQISVVWIIDNEEEYYTFTNDSSGSFYALRAEDGSIALYWMDNYDPHATDVELVRMTAEAPSAEALTADLLRPVIDMADGAQVDTALDLMEWTLKNHCMRMDSAALAENLRAAFAALEPADAQAFRDNYAKISGMALDAMGLNPETWGSAERYKPFDDANQGEAARFFTTDTETQRSLELLNAALTEVMG